MPTFDESQRARASVLRPATLPTRFVWLGVLAAVLLATSFVAVAVGPVTVSLPEVLGALGRLLPGGSGPEGADLLVTEVRLPRVLTAALVGGSLSIAGAAMQAVFRNPLAEPGITGVSSGAATVAVLCIVTGVANSWVLPLGAFVGALVATFVVQAIGFRRGGSPATLLLVGMSMNAFLGAVISAVIANATNAEDARSAMFWLNGDLTGRTMSDVGVAIVPLFVGAAGVLFFARELNMFALGETTAQSSGVEVRRVSQLVLAAAALTTAAGVAITGIIAFVGLVVPHLVRLMFRSDHTFLLPASFFLGGTFLVVADTCARMIFNPVVLQTGTVTALVGAPFLLYLVMRRAR